MNYKRYRHIIGFQRSKKYITWLKSRRPGLDFHHLLGSTTGRRYTDYLGVLIPHKVHMEQAERHKAGFFELFLSEAVSNLYRYAKHLRIEPVITHERMINSNYKAELVKEFIEQIAGE